MTPPPHLSQFSDNTPATENTDNQTLVYKATFSENVTGVDVSDFILSPDSAGEQAAVAALLLTSQVQVMCTL